MAAASKEESKLLNLHGRSGFRPAGVKPTFYRVDVRRNRRADIPALVRDSFAARECH